MQRINKTMRLYTIRVHTSSQSALSISRRIILFGYAIVRMDPKVE